MLPIKKSLFITFFSAILFFQYGCQQTSTPPAQSSIIEKFYNIGSKQVASDIIRTSDGGYIMVGTSYRNSSIAEGDILVLKVDSLGVEEWHQVMGKTANTGTGGLAGSYVKYHEEGIKVAAIPNGAGYAIAANRTYVAYPNSTGSTSGVKKHTKIVFYTVDNAGTPSNIEGYELRTNVELTDKVADFKIDGSNYIVTGSTQDVSSGPNHNSPTDASDIFTALLDANFNFLWDQGTLAYGFDGADQGTSVQVLPNRYLVCGTSEERYTDPTTGNVSYIPHMLVVTFTKMNGIPVNPQFYGNETHNFEGGYSTYDASNGVITVLGNVKGGNSSNVGKLAIFQVDETNLAIQTPNPSTFGMVYLMPNPPTSTSLNNQFKAQSIAALPNNGGFLISSTMTDNLSKDICISKVENNLVTPATGWPYYHGYATGQMTSPGNDIAGTVLPVVNNGNVEGTAFTATLDINTSTSRITWVRF